MVLEVFCCVSVFTFCPRIDPFWPPIFHICARLPLYIWSSLLDSQYFVSSVHAQIPPSLSWSSVTHESSTSEYHIIRKNKMKYEEHPIGRHLPSGFSFRSSFMGGGKTVGHRLYYPRY